MSNKKSLRSSPQLVFEQQHGVVVAPKQLVALFNKSQQSGYPIDTILEVYHRGFSVSLNEQDGFNRVNSFINGGHAVELDEDLIERDGLWANIHAKRERIKHGSGEHMRKPGSKGAPTPQALKRSQTKEETVDEVSDQLVGRVNTLRSLGPNITKGIPPTPHKTGKGTETLAKAVDRIRYRSKVGAPPVKEAYTGGEQTTTDSNNPASRFAGTTELTNTYKNSTPGQNRIKTIKNVVRGKLK
jgi:hypothetical protein